MAIKQSDWPVLSPLALFILLAVTTVISRHAVAMEFNTDILDAEDKKNIDLKQFSQTGYIMPGDYILTPVVNGEEITRETPVSVYSRTENGKTQPDICVAPALLDRIGLTVKSLRQIGRWHDGDCADFSGLKGVKLSADLSTTRLNMSVPQMYLEYMDAGWLPSSRWDDGVPGLLVDYNTSATVSKPGQGPQTQSAWINGTLGANYDAWRLRGDYQGMFNRTTGRKDSQQQAFDWSRIYLYRAIKSMQASLMLGEHNFTSDLFSGWNYTGAGLASDERQLPPRLRGYAPQISGTADTNARVTVSQQGRVLYDSTVPAGPFTIQDIDSSVRGMLDVTITEQDGRVKTSQVNSAYVPYLTRPGQIRYKIVSGRSRHDFHHTEGPMFGAGELSWGLNNRWSLYGGAVAAGDYNALAVGAGVDLIQLGTLSADVTQSFARFSNRDDQQGKSWRLSYSKRFDELDTDVTFAGYRFSERNYMTMQQYLDDRYRNVRDGRSKEMYTLSLNKNFPDQQLSLGLSLNHQTYWDRGESTYYSLQAYRYFSAFGLDNLSLGITASRSRYAETDKMNDEIALRLSVPWGNGTANYNVSSSGNRYAQTLGYSGNVGVADSYSVTAGMNHGGGERSRGQFSGYYSHLGDMAQTSFNMSAVQGNYLSAGLSAYGGATLTAAGGALHPGGYNGSTRLMVDTDGVADVPVDGGRVHTNRWGVGVVTDVSSYYRNSTSIDLNRLSDDVEARGSVVESALTEGAIGYRKFDVLKGQRLFAVLKMKDGSTPPFGAGVRNLKGRELGIVSEGGVAWLSGVQAGERLSVVWSGNRCETVIPPGVEPLSQLLLPCEVVAERSSEPDSLAQVK
ncbi:fimbria/pilus outer membrane usher protein [Salmonella enterica]|nr:PapC/FimD family outer membrane usher protein [Salmonella enterica subsp. enterica serovar Orientalis]EBJ4008367.1 PapC/FimD family outer membrane usher protein [Salmonella enterica]EBQ9235399.1 PapC/FimD family outer membrane usher protein [Salmonella enterica subsp. enterica serovar Orientalis]EKA1666417.1 fimbria/pilus outer membrane usher protein [Salmonella enterica]